MAAEVSWYQKPRIVQIQIYGQAHISNLHETHETVAQLIAEGITPVHILVDMTHIKNYPLDMMAFCNALVGILKHPNIGYSVMAGSSSVTVLKVISLLIAQISNINFQVFSSQEKALEYLYSVDTTLESDE